jgi:hypothetical protein
MHGKTVMTKIREAIDESHSDNDRPSSASSSKNHDFSKTPSDKSTMRSSATTTTMSEVQEISNSEKLHWRLFVRKIIHDIVVSELKIPVQLYETPVQQ